MEEIAVKVIADIFHRRASDPAFLQASDAVFAELAAAQTPEDQKNAHMALSKLMAQS